MGKKLRISKTFWVNLVMVAAGAVGGAMGTGVIADNPAIVGYFVAAQAVLNIVLRIFTGKPIKGV